ncbi:MAG: 4-alpha-glucanotransferase [Candidatus Omnitrophica bacterium]|nr:4-alpha-glucanotransferase [Candidatus Omnitrophota bacterium]
MANQPDFLLKKRAGVLVPLFSIYSKNSFGIGDFSDLRLAIDWVKEIGCSVLQLLPMNEMGPVSCPYDALSSFALEPVYISLLDLPIPKDKSIKRQIEALRKSLSSQKEYCDYSVKKEKLRILRQIFLMQKEDTPIGLLRFKEENAYWLPDFSLFKAIKDNFNGLAWYDWPEEFKERKSDSLLSFRKAHLEEIEFEEWVQWQLYEQFKITKNYAKGKKVLLKGDLPILVSKDSSDVWAHQEFFKLDFAAGAPPDMYCAKGQRWGMPTYNWDKIQAVGYEYLKEKLKYAGNFYDLLRIDHVVGLFRIWSIPFNDPLENKGLNGFFDPKDESAWGDHGRKILKVMLESSDMFLCAEDLGVIPKVCIDTLKELGIPGNDVQRWAKDWNVRHDFLGKEEYRFLSVAMLSTHDTTNWAAWWENEAGTVDEDLFRRKCSDHRAVGFERVKDQLFDQNLSSNGRLRWKSGINSLDKFLHIVSEQGRIPREHLSDFVDLWENSFNEKEKLWKILELDGKIRERCDTDIMKAVLNFILRSNSLLCINNIFDLLYLGGILKQPSYKYRINFPGLVDVKNWSLLSPIALEDLLNHKVNRLIKDMVLHSKRAS